MRRYFVDATHPVWGLQVLNYRWLLQGQRFYVGVAGGRKRLSILGGWCPEHHEYLDNARYFHAVMAREWIDALQKREGVRFVLEHLPPYSPNLNLIERFWKFLKEKALSRWHESFAAMQAAVARVLDGLEHYRGELETLMTENFQLWPQEAWNL